MTSVLQYLNFEGSRWWFSSWFPHPLVLGKCLCLQNLVGWQPWKRMSFIYLQEIWLQTLFYLNSFSLFQQLLKKNKQKNQKNIFTKEQWIVHIMYGWILSKSVARLYVPIEGAELYLYDLLPYKPTHILGFLCLLKAKLNVDCSNWGKQKWMLGS